jgi:outer membrane protein assembly factor BamB
LIEGSSDGAVWAFQPRTGQPIWHYRLSRRGLNVSPLVVGDMVYIGQGEENLNNSTQGMLLAFKAGGQGDTTGKADIWKLRGVMESKSSPILVDGRVYAADDGGNLYIVDAVTGKLVKKVKLLGTIVRGSPLYADGKVYLCSTSGWHCFRVTPTGLELVQKLRLDAVDEVSGSPVVSHGRIFLPTGARLYCLGTKDQKPAATPI